MRIIFARHGKDDERYRGGWSDLELLPSGVLQAQKMAEKLKSCDITEIIASDLPRSARFCPRSCPAFLPRRQTRVRCRVDPFTKGRCDPGWLRERLAGCAECRSNLRSGCCTAGIRCRTHRNRSSAQRTIFAFRPRPSRFWLRTTPALAYGARGEAGMRTP